MAKSNLDIRFYSQIIDLLKAARQNVVQVVNQTMVVTYYEIGRMIVEEEQNGKERADYGRELLKGLSATLTKEFGRGYSVDNLENMRRFYLTYKKSETLSRISSESNSETASRKLKSSLPLKSFSAFQLSWSHYLILMRIDQDEERQFYEIEASKNHWSVRELQRQFDSELYARLVLSRNNKKVKELSEKGLIIEHPGDEKKTLIF
ncbi:DUF1016 N-terminal domain-containing protein [Aquiflexum lacus]|uniref:DUF1016 N-terminal domain-containing protein n=1 Tax=Aquiflexum lacus TaxID=2483805 RepID=UPI001E48082E|nr:DUF1016 N-terminal domain-containing protein [Aquiflexum lacus]